LASDYKKNSGLQMYYIGYTTLSLLL